MGAARLRALDRVVLMLACYDLARNPPTYDAVAFLANLEVERLRRGAVNIERLFIAPGPAGGFRRDNLWPHSLDERRALLEQVLLPLCRMLPSSAAATCGRAPEGAWAAGEYGVGLPAILRALRAGSRPLRFPGPSSARARRLVTFTLREAAHHPLRNSRVIEWLAAAGELERLGYNVVFIRDARCADERVEHFTCATQAAADLYRRAELYSQAALNVGISNGPMWMSIFMDAPTLMLRPTTNAAGGCYDDSFFRRHGLAPGSQLPTSPAYQRLVWEDDLRDNIVRAVREMIGDSLSSVVGQ